MPPGKNQGNQEYMVVAEVRKAGKFEWGPYESRESAEEVTKQMARAGNVLVANIVPVEE